MAIGIFCSALKPLENQQHLTQVKKKMCLFFLNIRIFVLQRQRDSPAVGSRPPSALPFGDETSHFSQSAPLNNLQTLI